jgi:Spy/CpxP family protein refolding chaperone
MKSKTPVIITVIGLALVTGLSIAAATTLPPPPPTPAAEPAPAGPPGGFRARIAERLGLSADQQKAIDDLHAKQRAELQALTANQDLTPEVRREKARAIFDNYRAQMRAVLTPEQQQLVGDWRGRMGDRAREAGRSGPALAPGRGNPRGPGANPLAVVAMGDRIKDRIAEQLQLTDEQRDKLEHLGRAYRAQQREAAKKHLEEMRAVLTPEQRQKAEQLKQHFNGGPAGGPPPLVGLNEAPGDLGDDAAVELLPPPEEI